MSLDSLGKRCTRCTQVKSLDEFHNHSGTKDRKTDKCKECAKTAARDWYAKNKERGIANAKRTKLSRRGDTISRLYDSAKDRATARDIEFSISYEDIVVTEKCPILGVPLVYRGGKAYDDSFSLDRIDPSKGYIPGNVRVVSRKANAMKSNASKEELLAFASWVMKEYNCQL